MHHRRHEFARLAVVLSSVIAIAAAAAPAAAADAPTARQVIDRFHEALGGADRLLASDHQTTTGTFSIPAQGIAGEVRVWTAAPDRMLTAIEIEGIGTVRSGHAGGVAWSLDPIMGAQLLTDDPLRQVQDQANFRGLLYRDEDFPTLTYEGETDFQGQACHELTVVSRNGLQAQHYFAVDTGLLAGLAQTTYSPMGEIPTVSAIKEYREFDGVLVAVRTEQSMMGMQQIIELQDVSFEPFDESVFALPPEIEALLESDVD